MILDLIYPNVCGFCKRINKENVCTKCRYELKEFELAKRRKYVDKNFDEIAYLYRYDGIVRDRIIEYKFNESGYLYKTFSECLLKNKKIVNFIKNYDIIIPVPIHKKRKNKRGYNQTELIAKRIGKELGIKIQTKILNKQKNTKPQSTLNGVERKSNLQNAYILKDEYKLKNKKILLIDDIYTTGNTVNECCRVLRHGQPKRIGVLIIAKD